MESRSRYYFKISKGDYCVRLEDGREFCSDRISEVRKVASEMVKEAIENKKLVELEVHNYEFCGGVPVCRVYLDPVLGDVWEVSADGDKVLVRSSALPDVVSAFFESEHLDAFTFETGLIADNSVDVDACGMWLVHKLFNKPTEDNTVILRVFDYDSPPEYYLVGDRKIDSKLKQDVLRYLESIVSKFSCDFEDYRNDIEVALDRHNTLSEFLRWLTRTRGDIISCIPGC